MITKVGFAFSRGGGERMNPGLSEIPNFKKVKTVPQPHAGNPDPAGKHWLDASISGNRRIHFTRKLQPTTIREELDKVREGERMNTAATTFCPTRSPVRSIVVSTLHPFSTPRSPQTPSLPGAGPRSDGFRCGGRGSKSSRQGAASVHRPRVKMRTWGG